MRRLVRGSIIFLVDAKTETLRLFGLGVTCSSPNPSFVGSNPAEVDFFFHDVSAEYRSSRMGSKLWVPIP